MNKRIKQLSDIAYKNHLARNPNSSFGRRTDYDKEFAELIVRECSNFLKDKLDDHFAAEQLEEHFGVEE